MYPDIKHKVVTQGLMFRLILTELKLLTDARCQLTYIYSVWINLPFPIVAPLLQTWEREALFFCLRDHSSERGGAGSSGSADISCDIYSSREAGRGADDFKSQINPVWVFKCSATQTGKALHCSRCDLTAAPRIGPSFPLQRHKDPNHQELRLKGRAADVLVPAEVQVTSGGGSA